MLRKRVSLALTALSFFVANAASVAQADTSKGQTMTLTAQTARETDRLRAARGIPRGGPPPEHAELLRYERKDGRNATLGASISAPSSPTPAGSRALPAWTSTSSAMSCPRKTKL